jgi:hypothetical protein
MAQAAEGESSEERVRPVHKDHNLHIVFAVTLMAVLGTSSITPAFPKVVQELGVSSGQVGLLITVFTLPGVLLTSVWGVLSDQFGRRKIFSLLDTLRCRGRCLRFRKGLRAPSHAPCSPGGTGGGFDGDQRHGVGSKTQNSLSCALLPC